LKTRLKQLRERHKLSLRDLGKKTGIDFTILARIENNEREMRMKYAVVLADYYKVSLDYLLYRSEDDIKNKFGVSFDEVQKILDERAKTFKSKLHHKVILKIIDMAEEDLEIIDNLLERMHVESY